MQILRAELMSHVQKKRLVDCQNMIQRQHEAMGYANQIQELLLPTKTEIQTLQIQTLEASSPKEGKFSQSEIWSA